MSEPTNEEERVQKLKTKSTKTKPTFFIFIKVIQELFYSNDVCSRKFWILLSLEETKAREGLDSSSPNNMIQE